MTYQLHHGDCLNIMPLIERESVNAVICDPPYGLEFMGKEWDRLGDIGKISHNGPSERDGSTVFGRQRINYNGSANKKCRACGKWAWDYPDRKCQCDDPNYPDVKAHQARIMQEWHYQWAVSALRCAKPGAYLLAFGGTRTFHRLAVAIEDAGWEIRDTVMWVYGQGFPKSHDVSKAIDRETYVTCSECKGTGKYIRESWDSWIAKTKPYGGTREEWERLGGICQTCNRMGKRRGAEMEVIGANPNHRPISGVEYEGIYRGGNTGAENLTQPATPAAAEWDGWGTALKPAWEPIIIARKPIIGTVAENVQRYGTGAMNIDACRIETDARPLREVAPLRNNFDYSGNSLAGRADGSLQSSRAIGTTSQGRWPANLIHDGSAEVLAGFPMTTQNNWSANKTSMNGDSVFGVGQPININGYSDTGSAARFFYCAKASKQDRDEGCEGLETNYRRTHGDTGPSDNAKPNGQGPVECRNHHPTVKPTALMRYLCRLVTPPGGVILDPFMGSGSTGKAAMLEGFNFIGIDTEIEYVEIAARRIEHACEKVGIVVDQPMMFETKRETVDKPKQLILL